MKKYNIYNEDCITGSKKIKDNSIDLIICDPPFGINESNMHKHYKRDETFIIDGYVEAPDNYYDWTLSWMEECKRIIKDNGTIYIIIGHTNLIHILNASNKLNLNLINHIIWKYNFGVNTKNKYITSHYHILFLSKNIKYKFNTYCRFGQQEKYENNRSKLYSDMEDVWIINRDYKPKEIKNKNKLPDELLKKIIQYSSDPEDIVCDFFMGNFTTAYNALLMGRKVYGFEINKSSYEWHISKLENIEYGLELNKLKKVNNIIPENQGKKITDEDIKNICKEYDNFINKNIKKKEIYKILCEKYKRGKFSIKNIIDKNYNYKTEDNNEIK